MFRSLLRAISSTAASSPIESITLTFTIVTLVYFQLLHAVKDSDFFTLPSNNSRSAPSTYLYHDSRSATTSADLARTSHVADLSSTWSSSHPVPFDRQWDPVSVDEVDLLKKKAIKNVIVKRFVVESSAVDGEQDGVLQEDDAEAFWSDAGLKGWQVDVVNGISSQVLPNGRWSYEDVCVKDSSTSNVTCLVGFDSVNDEQHGRRQVVTIFLDADKSPEQDIKLFIDLCMEPPKMTIHSTNTRNAYTYAATLPSAFESAFSAAPRSTYSLFPATSSLFYMPTDVFARTSTAAGRGGPQEDVRSIKWIGYAVRALGVRFWLLAKNADSADIFVVLLGYVLMHLTFVRLFLNMRKMGSSFWLPSATLISSIFGFLFALLAAFLLAVPVDPICLSEALPFLVITVGFDKPFLLARAVFSNPQIKPVAAPYPPKISDLKEERHAVDEAIKTVENGGSPVFGKTVSANRNASNNASNGNALELDLQALHRGLAAHERIQREIAANKNRGIRWAAPVAASKLVMDAVQSVGPGNHQGLCHRGRGALRRCGEWDRRVEGILLPRCSHPRHGLLLLVYILRRHPQRHGGGERFFNPIFFSTEDAVGSHSPLHPSSGLPYQERSQAGSEQEGFRRFLACTQRVRLTHFCRFHPLLGRFDSCLLGELHPCSRQVSQEEGERIRRDQVEQR